MKIEEKIRAHLAAYKKAHNKTQKEMAELIGIAYSTYQDLEKGIVRTVGVLNKLKLTTGFNEKNVYSQGLAGDEIVKLRVEIIKINSFINVFLPIISRLSAKDEMKMFETKLLELQKATDGEYDRLYKEYLKEQEQELE